MHISGGRMSKSEIRKQKSNIILADGRDSFNEVEDRSMLGQITLDKRVIRGQMRSSPKINHQDNEPDYSPDILDNGKSRNMDMHYISRFYGIKFISDVSLEAIRFVIATAIRKVTILYFAIINTKSSFL